MASRRFYVNDLAGSPIELAPDQASHARKSLRLAVGDPVELFDGRGGLVRGQVTLMGPTMQVAVEQRLRIAPVLPRLVLAVAVPKGDRAATLVEAAAQLGVDRLVPIITRRSVVDPGKNKQARFDRIAVEAAKQCGRAWMMRIDAPLPLDSVLGAAQNEAELRLMADVQDLQDAPDPADPASNIKGSEQVTVLVGPEGGWTDTERQAARAAGFEPWQFGPNTLRVEMAALAAAAIIRRTQRTPEPVDEQD